MTKEIFSINFFFRAYIHIKYLKFYEQGEATPHKRPFQPDLWNVIIIWIILSGISILIIDYRSINDRFTYTDSFFRPFEALMNQCKILYD